MQKTITIPCLIVSPSTLETVHEIFFTDQFIHQLKDCAEEIGHEFNEDHLCGAMNAFTLLTSLIYQVQK